jgi:outer membrane lipoprotein LolB
LKRSRSASLAALVLALALSACSTMPPSDAEQSKRKQLYDLRWENMAGLEDWTLEGRLAVNDGDDGGSGRLNWSEQGDSSRMDFHGAFGRGAWRLLADADGAVLELADGARYEAPTVADLAWGQLGWEIPVDALAWWIRGLEAPGEVQARVLDETGRLVELRQRDWSIVFGRYRAFGGWEMPVKMTARQADRYVKLAVRSWAFPGGDPSDD